jgi:hypothetical protein
MFDLRPLQRATPRTSYVPLIYVYRRDLADHAQDRPDVFSSEMVVYYWCESFGSRVGPRSNNVNVRFGSEADMCSAKGHVRFTPKSGHWAAQAIRPNSIIIRSLTAGVRSLRCSPFLIFIPSDEDCDDRRAD